MDLYRIARQALFTLEPERAHYWTLGTLKAACKLGYRLKVPDRPVEMMGIRFPNPVGLSAGLDKNGEYLIPLSRLGFGFIEIGTVTPKPQQGNPKPRMFRLPEHQAIINRLGFNNKGVDFLIDAVNRAGYDGVLGINIGKNRTTPNESAIDDYIHCLRKVYSLASYVTVNISSPNTAGLRDLQEERALHGLLSGLLEERESLSQRHGYRKPLFLKLAPDLDDDALAASVNAINQAAPDGVIATNTTIDRSAIADHPRCGEPGGLSGKPLMEPATHILKALKESLNPGTKLIGVGGINSADDAVAKMQAGADLLQLYSGLVYQGPGLIRDCVEGLNGHDCQS